jgi:hypothetical protein
MTYVVRKLPYLKRPWKLQHVTYSGDRQSIRDIPESDYRRLGFSVDMTLEQARARRDQLNAQHSLKRIEVKRQAIEKRLTAEDRALNAFFNAQDCQEFEEQLLTDSNPDNKVASHWRATKRILAKVRLEPKDYNFRRAVFFAEFKRLTLSPSYCQKILRLMNAWGYFQARKHGTFFEPIAAPRGVDRERIADAYYDENEGGGVSDPITPKMLETVKDKIKPEWFNWFYLSVWFGLRPFEVDRLLKPPGARTWSIDTVQGVKVLRVYQSKLSSVPRDKRTKVIPCIVPEQLEGLKIIEGGEFKRPSHTRHIEPYFGEKVTLYGGRKGFEDLMSSLGQKLEDISNWLGHQSIERTWKNYKNKQVVRFEPVRRGRKA